MSSVHLGPTTEADLDFVCASESEPEHALFVGQWTREQHSQAIADEKFAHLIIRDAETKMPVGYVILEGRGDASQSLLLKRIVVTQKSRGYGRAALEEVQKLAFAEYGTHRLWLDVIETNTRARYLYHSCGFAEEGLAREALLHHGQYVSLVIMSVLAQEYKRRKCEQGPEAPGPETPEVEV